MKCCIISPVIAYLRSLAGVADVPGRRVLRSAARNRPVVTAVKLSTVKAASHDIVGRHFDLILSTDNDGSCGTALSDRASRLNRTLRSGDR